MMSGPSSSTWSASPPSCWPTARRPAWRSRCGASASPSACDGLLQLSEASFSVLYPALLVLIAGGVVGAFRLGYWSFGWIWTAIGLLVIAFVIMFVLGGGRYSQVRKVLGIRYREGFKILPAGPEGTQQELEAAAARLQPWLLVGVGAVVIAVSLYLMTSKPF